MKSFETWFRDFFLYSLSAEERKLSVFDAHEFTLKSEQRRDLTESKKLVNRLRWLFGATLYLSGFAFCSWILALSAIHLTSELKDAYILEKILFFASPNTWKKYILAPGGLFNVFRVSKDRGEYAFIFLTLGLIFSSLLSLIFSLVTINISLGKNLKELRIVSLALCFPVFGWIVGCVVILHFFFTRYREKVEKWSESNKFLSLLFKKYFYFLERRIEIKSQFRPKKIDFLELKKREEKLNKFVKEEDRYTVKKI